MGKKHGIMCAICGAKVTRCLHCLKPLRETDDGICLEAPDTWDGRLHFCSKECMAEYLLSRKARHTWFEKR